MCLGDNMTSLPFTYLLQGDVLGALNALITTYFHYGLFYIFVGGILFASVYGKTRSYGISGIIFILYSTVIGTMIPVEVAPFFLLLLGFLGAIMLIQIILNK